MAITEVTRTGWFGRIGSSIKGIFIGAILVVGSMVLQVCNERNAVRDIRANKEIGANVVSVGNDAVDAANEGKLVHLNGPAKTEDIVKNEQFGLAENAIRLSWKAKIYQWVENKESKTKKTVGGGEETVTTYSYKKEWVDAPVDSSKFKESGHDNTGKKTFQSGSSQAKTVTLGAFTLPRKLVSDMSWSEPYSLESLPEEIREKGSVKGGVFQTGTVGSPKIGDEKVTFTITRADDVSVMAVQTGNSFAKYTAKNGKVKFLLYRGLLSAEEVVKAEEQKAMILRWALRALGVILMFIGFAMIFKPLSVVADVIPFIGNLVGMATGFVSFILALGISFVIMAISWIFFRPLIGIPLLLIAIGCFVLLIMKLSQAKKQGAVATPPPPPPAPAG